MALLAGGHRVLAELPWALARVGASGGGRARGVLVVWSWWERLSVRWWRLRPVRRAGVLRYRIVRERAGRVVDLHIDNGRLTALGADRRPTATLRVIAGELAALRAAIECGELGDVAGVRATTLLAPRPERLGLSARPLPRSAAAALVHYFLVGLVAIHHPAGWAAAERYRRRWPQELRAPWRPRRGDPGRWGHA